MSRKPERPEHTQDPVAELIRVAGRREPAPDHVVSALRRATDATWRRQLANRRRRRSVLAAAAALAALAAGLVLFLEGPLAPRASIAEVERVDGAARLIDSETERALEPGDTLYEGMVVDTGGPPQPARIALRLADGHHLRLDANSRLRLESSSRAELQRGTLYGEAGGDGGALEIGTRWGTVRDLGTRFEVRVGTDSLRVRVREGRIRLEQNGASRDVDAGAELRVHPDGSLELVPTPTYGESWSWILGVSPGFDIEGRHLREFLDWIAGETGWQIDTAPGTFDGGPTVLRGSIAGLGPSEALGAVLPGCGLRYRLEEGRLLIEPEGSEAEADLEPR